MKDVGKLIIGLILLAIGIYLATQAGRGFASGTVTVPVATVEIRLTTD